MEIHGLVLRNFLSEYLLISLGSSNLARKLRISSGSFSRFIISVTLARVTPSFAAISFNDPTSPLSSIFPHWIALWMTCLRGRFTPSFFWEQNYWILWPHNLLKSLVLCLVNWPVRGAKIKYSIISICYITGWSHLTCFTNHLTWLGSRTKEGGALKDQDSWAKRLVWAKENANLTSSPFLFLPILESCGLQMWLNWC